jgi:drug/metabolite transporter (DMT)-like permease
VIVSKRIGPEHPVMTNAIGMTAGAVVLLLAAVLAGETFALPAEGETQLAVLYLVAATVALFLAMLYVIQRWTASATAYVFVLMPIVALIVGALIADEEITATTILGGAIVFGGVYLGALARSDRGRD